MKNLYEDKSNRKLSSHRYLQSQLETNSTFFTRSVFTKKDLINLCHAFDINAPKNKTKPELATKLQAVIGAANGMVHHDIFSAVPSGSSTQETSLIAVTQDKESQERDMIARHSHDAESPVIVDQIENIVEAVTVGHLDAEDSSKQKGKGRTSRKSSSKGKRPMKILKTIKWPCGICEHECNDGVVCCDNCETWHHFNCWKVDANDEEFDADEWFCPDCRQKLNADSD